MRFYPPAEVNVSLQGSLDSFALPDVLVLLSSTKKDGELRVAGGGVDGRVWLEKGQVVHTEVSGKDTSAIDAVFQLLRLDGGTFSFQAEGKAPRHSDPVSIDAVLADAQVRLGEWAEISRVVSSLDAVVDMAAEAPADQVTVSRDQWHLLRTVAGGRSVAELMSVLGRSEFDTCKTVKQLVDFKLAAIQAHAGPPARQAANAHSGEGAGANARGAQAGAPQPGAREVGAAGSRSGVTPPAGSDGPGSSSRPTSAPSPAPAGAAAAAAQPGSRPSREPARQPDKNDEAAKAGAAAAAAVGNELEALAELASRPRRVRATTSDTVDPGERSARLAATKPGGFGPNAPTPAGQSPIRAPAEEPRAAEEAKALVAQLAALGEDDEEKVAQKVAEHLASGGELPAVPEGDEPINRGLLLKFLSSVRN